MRYFNTEGICRPEEHYMVRLDERLDKIRRQYVDRGKYFVINRGRQYGKTTTLRALEACLGTDYLVFSMDFQMLSTADFADEQTFVAAFIGQMKKIFSRKKTLQAEMSGEEFHHLFSLKERGEFSLNILFEELSRFCEEAKKPVVLMIAEMLFEYEADYQTGMDIQTVAEEIYQYTSGYPYLVSAICKYLDEKATKTDFSAWTQEGIVEAVKHLLVAGLPLFGSMMRHISEYPDLKKMLYAMLFQGEKISYNPDNRAIELACMFGYTVNDKGAVRVANRIFETRLYNFFLSEEEVENVMSKRARQDKNQFTEGGRGTENLAWE